MGGACSTHWESVKFAQKFWVGSQKSINHLENLCIEGEDTIKIDLCVEFPFWDAR
jgi:hypothetical protein